MKSKRPQRKGTKTKNKISSAQKKTWVEIGQLSETLLARNKTFDEMEWNWPSLNPRKKKIPVKMKNTISGTKKQKVKALKRFSKSPVRKRKMKQANESLRLYPFPSNKEIKPDPVAVSFFRFKYEPTVGNALNVMQMIKENTVKEVLKKLKAHKELTKYGRKVFGDDKTFLEYLFSQPRALGNKMPIEFLVDDKGAQIIIDELGRIEHGIYS